MRIEKEKQGRHRTVATLDTHRAVNKLQDAGAPEPLAVATVDVIEEAADRLVARDYLRAELRRVELTLGGIVLAVAAVAITVAELI